MSWIMRTCWFIRKTKQKATCLGFPSFISLLVFEKDTTDEDLQLLIDELQKLAMNLLPTSLHAIFKPKNQAFNTPAYNHDFSPEQQLPKSIARTRLPYSSPIMQHLFQPPSSPNPNSQAGFSKQSFNTYQLCIQIL